MLETFYGKFWKWSSAIRTVSLSTLGDYHGFFSEMWRWIYVIDTQGKKSEMQLDSVGFCPAGLSASIRFIHGYHPQLHTRHWCCVCKRKHKQHSLIGREVHLTETERAMIKWRSFPSHIVSCVFNCMTRRLKLSWSSAGFPSKWLHAALQPAGGLLITYTSAMPLRPASDPTLLLKLLLIPHEMSVARLLENKHCWLFNVTEDCVFVLFLIYGLFFLTRGKVTVEIHRTRRRPQVLNQRQYFSRS